MAVTAAAIVLHVRLGVAAQERALGLVEHGDQAEDDHREQGHGHEDFNQGETLAVVKFLVESAAPPVGGRELGWLGAHEKSGLETCAT